MGGEGGISANFTLVLFWEISSRIENKVVTKFAKTIVCVIQVQFFARLSKKTYLLNGNIYLR